MTAVVSTCRWTVQLDTGILELGDLVGERTGRSESNVTCRFRAIQAKMAG